MLPLVVGYLLILSGMVLSFIVPIQAPILLVSLGVTSSTMIGLSAGLGLLALGAFAIAHAQNAIEAVTSSTQSGSEVIRIDPLPPEQWPEPALARAVELLLRRAFGARRKMLRNTLAGLLPADQLADLAEESRIALDQRRAHPLDVLQIAAIMFDMRGNRGGLLDQGDGLRVDLVVRPLPVTGARHRRRGDADDARRPAAVRHRRRTAHRSSSPRRSGRPPGK